MAGSMPRQAAFWRQEDFMGGKHIPAVSVRPTVLGPRVTPGQINRLFRVWNITNGEVQPFLALMCQPPGPGVAPSWPEAPGRSCAGNWGGPPPAPPLLSQTVPPGSGLDEIARNAPRP